MPTVLRDSVSFTAMSGAAGFNLQSFLWNFDDNTTQTTLNAIKKFSISGNQTIHYRIFADNGCAADTTKAINIFPEPIAKIGASSPACATDAVLISDTSSITAGTITNRAYDFGDGNTLSRNSNTPFSHAYTSAGNFSIKLIATSNNGCRSDTAYRTVTVFAKPIAKYGYRSGYLCRRFNSDYR
jgi:PKD repeat protein